MGKGAILIGIVCIITGVLGAYAVISSAETPNWLLIHLSVLIGVGIALIVLNKEEEKVEQRKDLKSKESKK